MLSMYIRAEIDLFEILCSSSPFPTSEEVFTIVEDFNQLDLEELDDVGDKVVSRIADLRKEMRVQGDNTHFFTEGVLDVIDGHFKLYITDTSIIGEKENQEATEQIGEYLDAILGSLRKIHGKDLRTKGSRKAHIESVLGRIAFHLTPKQDEEFNPLPLLTRSVIPVVERMLARFPSALKEVSPRHDLVDTALSTRLHASHRSQGGLNR